MMMINDGWWWWFIWFNMIQPWNAGCKRLKRWTSFKIIPQHPTTAPSNARGTLFGQWNRFHTAGMSFSMTMFFVSTPWQFNMALANPWQIHANPISTVYALIENLSLQEWDFPLARRQSSLERPLLWGSAILKPSIKWPRKKKNDLHRWCPHKDIPKLRGKMLCFRMYRDKQDEIRESPQPLVFRLGIQQGNPQEL